LAISAQHPIRIAETLIVLKIGKRTQIMFAILALKGFSIHATDGRIGTVNDFLVDDRTWKIRWLVVEIGSWLTERKILVHPSAIGKANYEREELPVRLTRLKMKDSPSILSDEPVSTKMENSVFDHYGWDPIWGGNSYFGTYPYEIGSIYTPTPNGRDGSLPETSCVVSADDSDPHLLSMNAIEGYHIKAKDGPIGHIDNFLVDEDNWDVRYLVVDTRNWLPGRSVLISPYAVTVASWLDRDVSVDVTREQVKESPGWDPADVIAKCYQERLHRHYGLPGDRW
jgi:hypothetical protein